MNMHNPPHPGEVLREMYFEPLGLTVTEAANALDVTRQTLSGLVNCKTSISIDMAFRLTKAFDTTPEMWIDMQSQYDLWQAKSEPKYKEIVAKVTRLVVGKPHHSYA